MKRSSNAKQYQPHNKHCTSLFYLFSTVKNEKTKKNAKYIINNNKVLFFHRSLIPVPPSVDQSFYYKTGALKLMAI